MTRTSYGSADVPPELGIEQIVQDLFASIHELVWCATFDGQKFLLITPAVQHFYGCTPEEFAARPQLWLEAVHPEDRPWVEQESHKLQSGERVHVALEYRLVRPDGQVLWVADRKTVVCDAQGTPVRLGGVLSDITARREAEAAQQSAHEELQRVIGSIRDYVFAAEIAPHQPLKYRYISPVVEQVTGRPPEFYLASPERWLETVHPDDLPRQRSVAERAWRGEASSAAEVYRIVRPDGAIRWVRERITATSLGDGHYRIDGVGTDITEKVSQQQAFQESERRYRLLATHATDIIAVFTPTGDCTYISPACEALLDFTPEELIGRNVYDFFHPEDRPTAEQFHADVLNSTEVLTGTWRVLRRDGSYVWMETSSRTFTSSEDGRPAELIAVSRDVTSRRAAEQQLRLQSLLLESVRESVVATDLQGRILYWGGGAERLYGHSADEALGQSIEIIVAAQDVAAEHARMQHVIDHGSWSGEYLQRRQDGSHFWADTFISLVRDEHGQPAGFIGIDRDISERRQAEQQLQARTHELQAITDNAPDLIARLDRRLQFLFVSRAWNDVTVPRGKDYLQHSSEELGLPREFCTIWNRELERVFSTGEAVEMEFELPVQGQTRCFQALAAPETRQDEQIETVVVIARDVTAHRMAAEQLKDAEDRFRAFMEHSPSVAFIKDEQGRYVYSNHALYPLLDPAIKNVVGLTDYDIFPQDVARQLRENDRAVLSGQDPLEDMESIRVGAETRHYLVIKFPLNDRKGRSFVGGVAVDLTERKKAEDELQQNQATLAHVARLSTMGEMVAGIAHEIAQPLSAISNFAAASRRLLSANEPPLPKIEDWIDLISAQAQRAGEIIGRLRQFVRGAEPRRTACRLHEVVDDSIKLVAPELKRYCVRVRLESPPPGPVVMADDVQIQQVLVNLLRNACEAMQETPLERREVRIACKLHEAEVEVLVTDQGAGLPADDPHKVLGAFYTTKQDGMGMGLAVSRRIIEAHGGRLWATAGRDGGAEFHFSLPAFQGEPRDDR